MNAFNAGCGSLSFSALVVIKPPLPGSVEFQISTALNLLGPLTYCVTGLKSLSDSHFPMGQTVRKFAPNYTY